MANFAPLKVRFLSILKENLDLFSIRGSFLDYGSGKGDVAEFLVSQCEFNNSFAFDPSNDSAFIAEKSSAGGETLKFITDLSAVDKPVDLAVLFDVIEHVPDCEDVLQKCHRLVRKNGWMAVTVPYNQNEWGFDDEFYGHLRRLSRDGVVRMLEQSGWNVVRVLDPTFPSFWFIRRIHLLLGRFTNRYASPLPDDNSFDLDRTLISSRRNSWRESGPILRMISESTFLWKLIRKVDLYFESIFCGFELFLLCQRRDRAIECEICGGADFTHYRFFLRYGLQRCPACGSERLLPECIEDLYNSGYYTRTGKRFSGVFERLVQRFRETTAQFIHSCQVPDKSLLDIGCGRGIIISYLKQRGWRTLGTQMSESAAAAAVARGAEVLLTDVPGIPKHRPFGAISMLHVIEHMDNLKETLSHVNELLLPGGLLILEYPSANSLLKAISKGRWLGYDPPNHRLQINPEKLADRLGLMNFRLLSESNFSLEYSFFLFAQTLANMLMPFQRDAFFRYLLQGQRVAGMDLLWAGITVPIFAFALPLFCLFQPVAALLRRGCIVRQIFRKTDIV